MNNLTALLAAVVLLWLVPFLLDQLGKAWGRSLNDKPGTKHGRWF
jgi:hypothetical protein